MLYKLHLTFLPKNRLHRFFIFLCILSTGKIASAQVADLNKQMVDYVNQYKDIAIYEMLRAKIPASITLAQGLLESNHGTSRLAKEAHNHFGIKCKSNWNGNVIHEDDDDFQECFRSYEDAFQSYRDHSDFLTGSSRYAFLFDYEITDYRSWANGLKKAGYATNPNYAPQLIELIEKYRLNQYDKYTSTPEGIRDTTEKHAVYTSNGVKSTKALKNDTYIRIANENKMKVAELLQVNDLNEIKDLHPGDIVYIQPKKNENKAFKTHVMKTGESMHDVSQQYGIKLHLLLSRNGLKPGEEPSQGETITLNKKNKKKIKKRQHTGEGRRTVDMTMRIGDRTRADSIMEARYKTQVMLEQTLDTSLARIDEKQKPEEEKPYMGNIENDTDYIDNKPDEVSDNELYHFVAKGETLYGITQRYKISMEEIFGLNKLHDSIIKIGQRLQVTNHKHVELTNVKSYTMDAEGYYTIQEGDSIKGIANQFNFSVQALAKLNNIHPSDSLVIGDKLLVVRPDKENDKPTFYMVKPGDTLFSIAQKFDITVADLKRINNLTEDYINEGMKLFLQ